MMTQEALGVLLVTVALAVIGLGPTLFLIGSSNKRVAYSLGIAPVVGFCLVALLGFPLARFVAPVRLWALPFTLLLGTASLLLTGLDIRAHPESYRDLLRARSTIAVVLIALICYMILVAPVTIYGVQYAAFRGNPNDAFLYQSLAETLRVADWQTILRGVDFSPANADGVKRLAEASPTSLFIARGVGVPLQLNLMAALAWAAQVNGVTPDRFYLPFSLLLLLISLPVSLVIGDAIGLSRPLKYLATAAVVLGFWTRFSLEYDAAYQLSAIPVLLLAVLAWMLVEQEPAPFSCPGPLILFGLGTAVIVVLYLPVATVLVGGLLVYLLVSILKHDRHISGALPYGASGILAVGLLALTGQIDFVIRVLLPLAHKADTESNAGSFGLDLVRSDGLGALWGIPASILNPGLPHIIQRALPIGAWVLGISMTGGLILTGIFVLRRAKSRLDRITYSMIIGGVFIALVYLLRGNLEVAGKAFTFVFAFVIFGIALTPFYLAPRVHPFLVKLGTIVVVVWLLTQFAIGIYLPFAPQLGGFFAWARAAKPEQYDLASITTYLNQHPPRLLLVDVPKDMSYTGARDPRVWTFAYYTMFIFCRYTTYFQSGLVTDNSAAPNLWLEDMPAAPDYAIMLKRTDYVGAAGLGTVVAETPELRLYRITAVDPKLFTQRESLIREDGWWSN